MTFIFAFLFAQSLLGDLSRIGAKPTEEPVVEPQAVEETAPDVVPEQDTASEPEPAVEVAPEPEPEPETKSEPEPESEPESVPEPEPESGSASEPEPEPEAETVSESAPETESEVETASETEAEPETEVTPESESESDNGPESSQATESSQPSKTSFEMPRSVKITSERTDYDRREGVIMFDKDVFVDDAEYKMHSDQLYVFLDGTNELKRIVAIGNVSITNETRVGTCAKAAYTKSVGKVVMYGDASGVRAKLADYGKRKSEVEGRKITFWIDSEQVEVEGSTVTLDAGGYGGKEGAKKLLGK